MQETFVELDDVPGIFVDCCLDHDRRLVFLSCWGRDTAIQELLGRLTVPIASGGIDTLHLNIGAVSYDVACLDMERYSKKTGRVSCRSFGELSQLWIYDNRCVDPDRANRQAYVLFKQAKDRDGLWERVKDICPYPLLDRWKNPVLDLLEEHEFLQKISVCVGQLEAWHLSLNSESIADELSSLIQSGVLTAS